MKPADVSRKNENEVWTTLYGHFQGHAPIPKTKIGDTVRISKYKSIFTKGYKASFTDEIFRVSRVFRIVPTMYNIEDMDGEEVLGKFYGDELSPVNIKSP